MTELLPAKLIHSINADQLSNTEFTYPLEIHLFLYFTYFIFFKRDYTNVFNLLLHILIHNFKKLFVFFFYQRMLCIP